MKTFLTATSFLVSFIIRMGFVNAQTVSFEDIWRTVHSSSSAQEAAALKTQSMEEGASRAQNHWLPRVYLDARSYQTNDPGPSLLGLLEQRKIEAADFYPDSLNRPGSQTFTRGALGAELALFEGGMKQAQVSMYKHMVRAEKLTASQIEIEQYAQSSLAYGSIASIKKQKQKLQALNSEVSRLIKGYQLGQKSNPVGYSGLLGMKSLANRITGLIDHLEAIEKASYGALKEMGVQDVNWAPHIIEAKRFVDDYISDGFPKNEATQSYKSLANAEGVQALEATSKMERARYLPRVGAFAESYVFNGSRDTANGYMAGIYLQWSLFDPSDFGRHKEAKLNAMAAEKFNQASLQQENTERVSLYEAEMALRSNLSRLDESDRLLTEQTQVSLKLFKNGSIGALQFVEILNRRTDLISQQFEAELGLLKTVSTRVTKSKFEIPTRVTKRSQR